MGSSLRRVVAVIAVVVAGCAGVLVASSRTERADAAGKPNIIVIDVDDMRGDEMWAMPKTRALLQGTEFTNSYVSTSLCCPSRSAFLSGQYATNNKVFNNYGQLNFDHKNQLGAWMHDAGYHTSLVGKYLNGVGCSKAPPVGWDHWQALCAKIYNQFGYAIKDRNQKIVYPTTGDQYAQPEVLGDRAVSTMAEARGAGKPYFMWLTPTGPHKGPGIRYASRYATAFSSWTLPQSPAFNEADVSDKPAWVQALPSLTPLRIKSLQNLERTRLRMILALDDMVEKVVNDVDAAGDAGNTIIMFTSDNGFVLGEHRIVQGKEVQYEPSMRVPLLVRGPGVPVGTNPTPVVNTDLAATIADFGGATPGRDQDGQSWRPYLSSPGNARRAIFHTVTLDTSDEGGGVAHPGAFGVQAGRFSYYELSTGERELYDHLVDPYELTNLANEPGRVRLLNQLSGSVTWLRACAGAACRITVPNLLPTANATFDCTNLACSFDAGASSDPEGTISYAWDFGDGATATGATPSHTYAASGTHTATVAVTDDEGGTDTFTMTVTALANNLSPTANFTAACSGLACTFDGSTSSDPDGTITGFSWRFDDGGTATGVQPAHTFAADGTYQVTLTVTDDRGGTGTVTIPVTVAAPNAPPVAVINYLCNGLACTFDGSASYDPDGTISLMEWDFGDGQTQNGTSLTHDYLAHETWHVVLRVTDNRGDTASTSIDVTV